MENQIKRAYRFFMRLLKKVKRNNKFSSVKHSNAAFSLYTTVSAKGTQKMYKDKKIAA